MWKAIFTNQFTKDFFYSVIFLVSVYAITHNPIVRPVPVPAEGNWSIQFMQHPLVFGLAGHNYLALRDSNGVIVSELHGLATDPATGKWKYVGTNPTDILQVWEFESGRYYLAEKEFPGIIISQGAQRSITELWNQALACKDPINQEKIGYTPYGFSFKNETINSNSVAYTLAKCMGFDTRHVGLWTPGATMNLLGR
ncbi:MAG: hypothetical protein ACAH17_00400 [Candidatus Paceibacterota bacterium]